MKREHLAGGVREQLRRYPPPFESHYGVVPVPPPEGIVTLGSAQAANRAAIEAIGRANALAESYPNHLLLSRVLVREEAVTSSAIEGTHSTLDQILEDEATFDPADTGDSEEHHKSERRQVKNYALVLERVLRDVERNRYDALSVGLIRDLQREVVKDDPSYKYLPGEVRSNVVWIGGGGHIANSIYNPAPPDSVSSCLTDHVSYLRCDGLQQLNQSIIVRMAIAHAHFEAVHPFPDGNGRVGRLLLPLMLAADGHTPLYVASYLSQNRPAYMDGLKAAQQRLEYAPLIEVMALAVSSAVQRAELAHQSIQALATDWQARRKWRKNSTPYRALELLQSNPVVTAKSLAVAMSVSQQAANEAIKLLVETKVLRERKGYKRNRVFAAVEVLQIFSGATDRAAAA